MPRRLSLPKEHGALVTLGVAAALAVAMAPAHLRALAAAIAVAAGFLARGPLERRVGGAELRAWDPAMLGLYAALALACVALIARAAPWPAALIGALVALVPTAGAIARASRSYRSLLVEIGGMVALGGAAGAAALAGGTTGHTSLVLALALGGFAAASIPIVRAETRRNATPRERTWLAAAGAVTVAATAAAVGALAGSAALAFAPRLVHAAVRIRWLPTGSRPGRVGARESAELAVFAILLVALV